jgi:hypothetical protein
MTRVHKDNGTVGGVMSQLGTNKMAYHKDREQK